MSRPGALPGGEETGGGRLFPATGGGRVVLLGTPVMSTAGACHLAAVAPRGPTVQPMDIDHAVTRIRSATERLDDAQTAVVLAREALQREAVKALVAVDGAEPTQQELVRRLYWDVLELPVKTIEAVVGSSQRVRQLAGPGPLLGSCEGCGTALHATSRTQLASGATRCPPCERAERQAAQVARLPTWQREEWDWGWTWDDGSPPPPGPPEWPPPPEEPPPTVPDGWLDDAFRHR